MSALLEGFCIGFIYFAAFIGALWLLDATSPYWLKWIGRAIRRHEKIKVIRRFRANDKV